MMTSNAHTYTCVSPSFVQSFYTGDMYICTYIQRITVNLFFLTMIIDVLLAMSADTYN